MWTNQSLNLQRSSLHRGCFYTLMSFTSKSSIGFSGKKKKKSPLVLLAGGRESNHSGK